MSEALEAFALCWPNDPNYLLFKTEWAADEDRKWFSKHYKTDRNGNPRGEPFIVRLGGSERIARLEEALRRLCTQFPTDDDMAAAGWERDQINAACDVYDFARAVLEPKQ